MPIETEVYPSNKDGKVIYVVVPKGWGFNRIDHSRSVLIYGDGREEPVVSWINHSGEQMWASEGVKNILCP